MGKPRTGLGLIGLLGLMAFPVMGGEPEIVSNIESFFATDDPSERARLAGAIEADAAYDQSKIGTWLHEAALLDPINPGEQKLNIPLDHGEFRTVLVRTPEKYTPDRAWPLIMMYHGSFAGVGEDWSMRMVERMLGERIDEFVVACPGNFGQDVINSSGEPSVEHPAILLALKKKLHLDSNRMYVMGISMGGYCCWTVATLHPDQFAGAISMSGTYSVPAYIDGFWETMLPNVRDLQVLHVWGDKDMNRTIQVHGVPEDFTVTALNQRFRRTVSELGLDNITLHEIPDRGHFPAFPPSDMLAGLLASTRVETPRHVAHRFRYIYQSPAYWLEGHTWTGEQWRMKSLLFITLRKADPSMRIEMGRSIHERLGELRGDIDGQSFDVHRTHVGEMTMWVPDGMTDRQSPITVRVDGREVFEGVLEPDLLVCLTQAVRTRDFDRLRWAGLRISEDGAAQPVTGGTVFPILMEVESYSADSR